MLPLLIVDFQSDRAGYAKRPRRYCAEAPSLWNAERYFRSLAGEIWAGFGGGTPSHNDLPCRFTPGLNNRVRRRGHLGASARCQGMYLLFKPSMYRKSATAAAAALIAVQCSPSIALTADAKVNTIQELRLWLNRCWRAPPPSETHPITITIQVSFTRSGAILGHPRITYESPEATDSDRMAYRVAAMEALQRCTPVPFTDAMGGSIAGHPFRFTIRGKSFPASNSSRRMVIASSPFISFSILGATQ